MSQSSETSQRRAANIFINYRREDSAGHAGRLFDRLGNHFPGRVFMDIDTIEPGVDFIEVIERAVGSCEVLIVVIGNEWLDIKDASGCRRLDAPKDFVRLEVAAALERNIRVIPVLVEGASMPRPEDLPPDLVRLARRNAIELSDARWVFDVDRLIQTIEKVLKKQGPAAPAPSVSSVPSVPIPPEPPVPAGISVNPKAWMALGAVLVLALAGWTGWRLAKPPVRQGGVEIGSSVSMVEDTPIPVEPEESPAMSEPQPGPEAGSGESASQEGTVSPAQEVPAPQPVQPSVDYGPDTCKQGFVWREARPEDLVCVTPETREATAEDNRQAETRRDPAGGPSGFDTCLSGYVWRDAFDGDHVCVTPETREQARLDNKKANDRRMRSVVRFTKQLTGRIRGR